MNDSSNKRNRAGNFVQEDTDLFLSLVKENRKLIESGKQEDKKQGWDNIHFNFNEECRGIKREVNALKMKLKNMKAQNKKLKLSNSLDDEQVEEDQMEQPNENEELEETVEQKARKRTKVFTQAECQFLQELVEKHCSNLDNSLTRDSVEQRNKAWETITEEFNNAQVHVITRDISELKTKYKNMKAQQKTNFKHDADGSRTITYTVIEAETIPEEAIGEQRKMRTRTSVSNLQHSTPAVNPTLSAKKSSSDFKNYYSDFLDDLNMGSDSDDEYPNNVGSAVALHDKEAEAIRKENLLLRNSVLKKKERLLELQIALAERNLRRHQL